MSVVKVSVQTTNIKYDIFYGHISALQVDCKHANISIQQKTAIQRAGCYIFGQRFTAENKLL